MKPADKIKELIKNLRYKPSTEAHNRILSNVLKALDENITTRSAQPNIWRIIMKSKITKLAAAAVLIIAALVAITWFGPPDVAQVALADVIEPILNARTASLDIILGSDENKNVIHDEVMGSRIRRTVSNIKHSDIIIDLEQQKLLTLDHSKKTAVYIELGGLDDLQDNPDFQVADMGVQEIEGQNHIVFVAAGKNETITIWADPQTALPTRIEQKTPNLQIACDNMKFDVELDESLFSMEVPEDYKIGNTGLDFGKSSESDFIEALRIWAEILEDGYFPHSIGLENAVEIGLKLDRGLRRANLTEQQQMEVAMRFAQGLVFLRFFKGQGQWHYKGAGVELGDASAPIFWYQPQDSENFRVIYGDLSVEEVPPEDLPDSELTEKQVSILAATEQWEKQEFIGKAQDIWTITSPDKIIADVNMTLTKFKAGANSMFVKLPYSQGLLLEVIFSEQNLDFIDLGRGRYEILLPADFDALWGNPFTIRWSMSLDQLQSAPPMHEGYRVNLQGLIPLESYVLTIVLEPDCGYEYIENPQERERLHFSWDPVEPPSMNMGNCGLIVREIQ
ncbi:MAG: LolA family protein [Planctomycetota bacterium]|jgi:hypothetical protein